MAAYLKIRWGSAMYSPMRILVAGLLVALAVRPALANNNDGFVVWDQNIASAVSASLPNEDHCGASPYALYGAHCHRQLNLSFDRPILYFTFLDRAALFLYKYHKVNYNQKLWDNTKLKFELNLKNVYEQEARARVELRYRFSTAPLHSGRLAGASAVALQQPSFAAN
jgi:hypothetical protein